MSAPYFTDREGAPRARVSEAIPKAVWSAIVDLIEERIANGALGFGIPAFCPDGAGCCGCDEGKFTRRVQAEIPDLGWPPKKEWPDYEYALPPIGPMMDLLEFVARNVGRPIEGGWHSYFNHHHLDHDRAGGLADLCAEVNRLFERNGIAFEMDAEGLMRRLAPEGLREALATARFQSGDARLDELLETARRKFLSPRIEMRREALEVLWDAFERLKTVGHSDKKIGIGLLLDRAAGGPKFRLALEGEARALTDAGNSLQIRHHETNQEPIPTSAGVDYLFHRLFALIQLLLKPPTD